MPGEALAQARPRSLIQMATGSGKTYTAVTQSYRLLKYAKTKRILFLVDGTNQSRVLKEDTFQGWEIIDNSAQ